MVAMTSLTSAVRNVFCELRLPRYEGRPFPLPLVIIYTARADFYTFRTIYATASPEDTTRAEDRFSWSKSQDKRGITPVNGYARLAHHCGVGRRRAFEVN